MLLIDVLHIFFRIALKEMFYDTIDRIDIIKIHKRIVKGNVEKEERLHERCYNVKKVGTAGVCQIKRDTGIWGFCSSSCDKEDYLDHGDPYEEADFKYYEVPPEGSQFSGSKLLT